MKCTTTIVAIATLFLASCKVVEIDKQPVKTTVENTPTVNVANFPASSGNVNANVTNTNPIPVSVKNSTPIIVTAQPSEIDMAFQTGEAGVTGEAGFITLAEYIATKLPHSGAVTATMYRGNSQVFQITYYPTSGATVTQMISIPVPAGHTLKAPGTMITYRKWRNG
jgi:hypothetical protein